MESLFFPEKTKIIQKDEVKKCIEYQNRNFLVNIYASSFLGFAFSTFSQGLLPYLIFYLLFEMKFAFDVKCAYTKDLIVQRIIIVSAGIVSFFVGRKILLNDNNPFRSRYEECPSYRKIWYTFTGMGDPDEAT